MTQIRIILLSLLIILMPSEARSEKTKEEWLTAAQLAAEREFKRYHVECKERVVVRAGQNTYYEFSGNTAKVEVFGLYRLTEADRLNGKLWSGKIVVELGDSARQIRVDDKTGVTTSEWGYGREPEFDFVYENGKWAITGEIHSYVKNTFYLQPNVSCPTVSSQPVKVHE